MEFDTLFKGEKLTTDDSLRTLLEKMIGGLYEQAKSKLAREGAV